MAIGSHGLDWSLFDYWAKIWSGLKVEIGDLLSKGSFWSCDPKSVSEEFLRNLNNEHFEFAERF